MKPRIELTAREVEHLHQSLMRRLGDTSVPTLPHVAVRVVELVGNPNSSIKQFAEVIQTDQALTGRLLRMANSAYFAQREPVTKLERAMVLLGLDRLKAVALGFHLCKLAEVECGPFSTRRLWTQSIYRAWIAFRIAERFDRAVAGEAFIIGLMSDAGLPMMPKLSGEKFLTVVNLADPPPRQFLAEFKQLDFTHVDIAAALCQMWKLPDVLTRPICQHHTPAPAANAKSRESVLHAAAYFVGTLSLDPPGRPAAEGAVAALAQKLFAMSPPEIERLLQLAAQDFKASRDLFSQVLDDTVRIEDILEKANSQLAQTAEGLVEDSLETEGGTAQTRFVLDGMILEMEKADNHRVKVFIADSAGNRIVAEQIDTRAQSHDDIRQRLLLDAAGPDVVASIFTRLNQLAA